MLRTQTGEGTQRWARWGTPPGGDPPASRRQAGDAGPLPSRTEQRPGLAGTDAHFGYGFPPFVQSSAQTANHGRAGRPTIAGYPTQPLPIRTLVHRKVRYGPTSPTSPPSGSSWLVGAVACPSEGSGTMPAGWSPAGLPRATQAPSQCPRRCCRQLLWWPSQAAGMQLPPSLLAQVTC